jgi:hypothetical protein
VKAENRVAASAPPAYKPTTEDEQPAVSITDGFHLSIDLRNEPRSDNVTVLDNGVVYMQTKSLSLEFIVQISGYLRVCAC